MLVLFIFLQYPFLNIALENIIMDVKNHCYTFSYRQFYHFYIYERMTSR